MTSTSILGKRPQMKSRTKRARSLFGSNHATRVPNILSIVRAKKTRPKTRCSTGGAFPIYFGGVYTVSPFFYGIMTGGRFCSCLPPPFYTKSSKTRTGDAASPRQCVAQKIIEVTIFGTVSRTSYAVVLAS
jgi:hypothetical protein